MSNRFSHALLVGVAQPQGTTRLAGVEHDLDRWEAILERGGTHIDTLRDRAATGEAVTAAFARFCRELSDERKRHADTYGVFLFAGYGYGDESGEGLHLDGLARLSYSDMVRVLDDAFPTLKAARESAGVEVVLSPRLAPAVLAILDAGNARPGTAPDEPSAPANWVSRSTSQRVATSPRKVDKRPRLSYHARQIAPQGSWFSGETLDRGGWQGDITRNFAPIFETQRDTLDMFSQEIGAGTLGYAPFEVRGVNGDILGTCLCTNGTEKRINGADVDRERALWHVIAFPDTFTLVPLDEAPPQWSPTAPLLNAANLPFPPTNPAIPPPSIPAHGYRVLGVGLAQPVLGYMWFGPQGALTEQWWAMPYGVIDNHGFLAFKGSLMFQRLNAPQTTPAGWRVLKTK